MSTYKISSLEELVEAGGAFRIEDVDPGLMTLRAKIFGDQFESSLTGEVAKALGEFQVALYRAAAEALHGAPNVALLTAEEKERFEVVITISPGCSDLKISGWRYLLAFLEKATHDMDSKHKCIVACFAIAGFTCVAVAPFVAGAVKSSVATDGMVKQAEALAAPIAAAVKVAGDATAKAARAAESVQWGGRYFSHDEIRQLNSRTARQEAQTDVVTFECRVVGVRKDKGLMKVDLEDVASGVVFTAKMPPAGLFEDAFPERPTEVAGLMEVGAHVRATIFIRETKSRTDRVLASWEVLSQ